MKKVFKQITVTVVCLVISISLHWLSGFPFERSPGVAAWYGMWFAFSLILITMVTAIQSEGYTLEQETGSHSDSL